MPTGRDEVRSEVRFREDRKSSATSKMTRLTQLYGPAVRCKSDMTAGDGWSCASVSGPLKGAICSWPSWISAHTRSHSRIGPEGRLGHQITDATARPFLHLLNPTRRPRREFRSVLTLAIHVSSLGRRHSVQLCGCRTCAFRSCGLGSRRSKRSAPACWRARLPERCDVAVAPQP